MPRNQPPTVQPFGSARHPPPHFAGRKDELAALNQGLDRLLRTGDPTGGIVLVTGVPGVGKTQLARKFSGDALARHKRVVSCVVETSVLESPVSLVLDMARALDATDAARRAADMDSRKTGGGLGVARFFSRSHTKEHIRHIPSLATMLRETQRTGMWKGCDALVLVVDELQTVTSDGMAALRVLHEGNHGCPIYLLGVGLQHTPFVLANPGTNRDAISRPNEPIRLGCLDDADALEAVAVGLANQGHDVPDASARSLAAASQGFPQHIHGYLAGALSAIAEHGHLEAGAALTAALQSGHRHRDAYYDMTADKMAPDRSVIYPVVALMQQRNTVLTRKDAARAVTESGDDGDSVLRQAIEHGVLELNKGEVSFANPSFHTHMRESLMRGCS